MVDKPNNQSSIDRQYLKAMGIDLWVGRDSVLEPTAAAPSLAIPSKTPDTSPAKAAKHSPLRLADLSASEFVTAVANLTLSATEPSRPAQLLVVTEGSNLSADCTKLLESMFNAIEFDRAQWLHAGISQSKDAVPIKQLAHAVTPKALVIMLKTGGIATALQSVRGVQHGTPSLPGFMVASFHPQDLLDNPETKRPAWEDLKQLRQWLG